MASKPFTLRLPDEVREHLKFLSATMHRSQSSIAAEMLELHVSSKAYRTRAIQDAKAEAQAGHFVSHEAVEKWLDSLGTDDELPVPTPDPPSNAS